MKVGSKDFLAERGIKAWATVPLEYLKREIAPDRCADSRVRHGMILWSWCGPEATEYVSVRDEQTNKPILDEKGQPIPARRQDLAKLLGMDKGNLSRFLKRFKRKGSVVFEHGRMYLIYKPAAFDPKSEKVVSTTTFHIADIVVSTDNLPTDEVVRTEALRLCEEASTAWKKDFNDVRTRHRELFRPRALALGILIDKRKKRKNSREEGAAAAVDLRSGEEGNPAAAVPALPRRDEVAQIVACARQFSKLDWSGAEKLLDACRAIAPDAPVAAINHFIQANGPKAQKYGDGASGFLIKTVPESFLGEWQAVMTLPDPRKPEDQKAREERERIERRKANLARLRTSNAGA